jgi:hypothetical protein
MYVNVTSPALAESASGWDDGATLTAHVHQATLVMSSAADLDAPGTAITLKLCGSWNHTPPCPFPHHTHVERTGTTVSLRVLFVSEPENENVVRERIDTALSLGFGTDRTGSSTRWELHGSTPAELTRSELARARRLAGV